MKRARNVMIGLTLLVMAFGATPLVAQTPAPPTADNEVAPKNLDDKKKRRLRQRRARLKKARESCLEEDQDLKGKRLKKCVDENLKKPKTE